LYNCKITCGLLYTITDKAELLSCLWHGISCDVDVAINLGYVAHQHWGGKCFGDAKVSKSDKTKTLSAVTNKSGDSNIRISTACFIDWYRELILEASKKLTEALKDWKNLQAVKVAYVMLTTGNDKLNNATSHQKATEGEDTWQAMQTRNSEGQWSKWHACTTSKEKTVSSQQRRRLFALKAEVAGNVPVS